MSGSNTVPLKLIPAVGYFASEYAFALTNLSIISPDDEIGFLNLSVSTVDESTSAAEANYLDSNLLLLDSEITELEKASNAVSSLGKTWLKRASKYPTERHDVEVQKKNQLDSEHDTAAIRNRAASRLLELRKEG